MREEFQQIITQLGYFSAGLPVVVGVSGGADSLALLHLMKESGINVIPAHYNHHLRPESDEDATCVSRLAAQMGLRCIVGEGDVARYSAAHGLTVEAAGRALRYEFLFNQARLSAAQVVAVAHHADDQAETVLLHLLRGSGTHGLQGMAAAWLPNPWSEQIALVRPLLGFWKAELEAYCQEQGLEPVQDQSNLDTGYLRNRLRHELIPLLETYQPALRPALLRLSEIAQGEQALLAPLVAAAWQNCLLQSGSGYVSLGAAYLRDQPSGLQRLLCRRALGILRPGLPDVDFQVVERMNAFLRSPPQSRQADLAAGLRLSLEGDVLWLAGWEADLPVAGWPQLPPGQGGLAVSVPGETILPGGWVFHCVTNADVDAARQKATENPNPYQAWLDLEQCGEALQLRPRWGGARFQPLGLDGRTQKLSDLMINSKLARRARKCWPLLCAGEQVLWIPGLALAHPARLTSQTRRVLYVQLVTVADQGR